MTSKKILGLDIGTNSIGWALIQQDFENKEGKIIGMGSRIIPMSQDILGDFDKGNSISQTATRTGFRSIRRLRERHLLRRERLHRVLNVLGWLPTHYASQIDFEEKVGQFIGFAEPKLPYDETGHFIFQDCFAEMMDDLKSHQPELLSRVNKKGEPAKVPYDWTIYYLRKKALTHALTKQELAWLVLNFNQKRGYYQLRGEEEEENPNKLVEFHSLKIVKVEAEAEPNGKGETWYSLHLENGWIYRRTSKTPLDDWQNKTREFIVTTDLNPDGTIKTDKEGAEKRSFRSPGEDDWTLIKKKTEQQIEKSNKTVGEYIYEALLQNPNQKIRGKLVRTIERKFYKTELKSILTKQMELQPELFTDELYNECVRELYQHNEAHQLALSKRNLKHLFVDDIIFYQRPLRSQKSSIANCPLESRSYQVKDKEGNLVKKTEPLKAIPKSHPLYQEFRVCQWLYNLKIYTKEDDKDVTAEVIPTQEEKAKLFDHLMSLKEVNHVSLFEVFFGSSKGKPCKEALTKYRWNYVFDDSKDKEADKSRSYPLNDTRAEITKRLKNVEGLPEGFLTSETETQLWHIIYSVTDKLEYNKALESFATRYNEKYHTNIDTESFLDAFVKFPPFKSDYGAYSSKAIKKLLPLMRMGSHWDYDQIDGNTHNRIEKIIHGEADNSIRNIIREKAKNISLTEPDHFQGLPLWLAQYVVYDRHAEAALAGRWQSAKDLEAYLEDFRQHSLRNPIVEQVVTETLRVVRDIWQQYGAGAENYFDEIHVELGREMKNTAEDRKRISNVVSANEATNQRIKLLIAELKDNTDGKLPIDNVRPHSPMQQEALKIYEEGVLTAYTDIPDDIVKISTTAQPSLSELHKYKLWLEQKYRSPYTGDVIPLSRLFTPDYEIEHVIPQSRFFDDSLSNKVICEAAVNELKDNQLALEFIKNHGGKIIATGMGKEVKIYTEEEYHDFVKRHYDKNRGKRNKLLMDEIPDKMIERQMNDTRYISKFVSTLLSNIVRDEQNDDGINSKHLLPGNGKITTTLKQDWGLNAIWNELILPRFERMNELTKTQDFTSKNTSGQLIPTVPLELAKGFNKKRIDHRHHALDALVIACATRDHINLLNNKHAKSKERFDLNRKLRTYKKVRYTDKRTGEVIEKEVPKDFIKPWPTLTQDARLTLETTVVSFKQNLRVINKTTNHYQSFRDEAGNLRLDAMGRPKKGMIKQTKGDSWAIRKPMHKDTIAGEVQLDRVKVPKGKILTATRKPIDTSFKLKTIESITDTGIQKILTNYLKANGNDPELAFTPEGLEEMNKNIHAYNNGKPHQPIYKVRIYETGSKFPLGHNGNKKTKYVETAKGTNLFFAVYGNKEGIRSYVTIPLNEVIERQKQGLSSVPLQNEKEEQLLFHLSPNDLVYVPETVEETLPDFQNLTKEQARRIYKMVSCTGSECHFVNARIASLIKTYDAKSKIGEMGSLNKQEVTLDVASLIRIKETCIKLHIDRLGNVKPA